MCLIILYQGCVPTLLRTQYRCHPRISSMANGLFYGGMLEDGVSHTDRKPLLVCFSLCLLSFVHFMHYFKNPLIM